MSENYCMEKLEQLICDEKRTVTYKMLSRELKIHVNKARNYLMKFLEKNEDGQFKAYYFLAGFCRNSESGVKAIKVAVVSEDALEKTKKDFINLTSCHIYSVNKGKLLTKDEVELYLADISQEEEQNMYSAIRHSDIEIKLPDINVRPVLKTEERNSLPKKQKITIVPNGSASFTKEKETEKKEELEKISPAEKDGSKVSKNSEPKSSPDEPNKKKGTLASMWQKKEGSIENSKKETSKAEGKGKQNNTKSLPKNNILSMFSRQAEKNSVNTDRKVVHSQSATLKENSSASLSPETKTVTVPKNNVSKEVNKSSKSVKRKSKTRQSSHSSKTKSETVSDDELQSVKKKRRRICVIGDSDSDSDSECEEEQDKAQRSLCTSEDNFETPTPQSDDSEEPIPPTPPIIRQKGKAKVWKTVQKTYQDEDGFFVTKTQKELVSASEESDEDPLKVKADKKMVKESGTNNLLSMNKKQASLTSFFKQK